MKPQMMTFSSSGRKMGKTLTVMSLSSLQVGLVIAAPFKFSLWEKVTKFTTNAV